MKSILKLFNVLMFIIVLAYGARSWPKENTSSQPVFPPSQIARAAAFPSRAGEFRGVCVASRDSTDWDALMSALKAANFNAVFPLMCNADSANYPSYYAPQSTRKDLMRACMAAAGKYGIEVHVWRCAWQAPGTNNPQRQKFYRQGRMVLSLEQAVGKEEQKNTYTYSTRWLDPSDERNRQLEFDMCMELVARYHPDGLFLDYMRYPTSHYCYCNRCRIKFQQWAGIHVKHWPQDCAPGGIDASRYQEWRRYLITSMVARIAAGVRAIEPGIKISLAARASLPGSFQSDAQDWVAWAKSGLLNMVCPMDYTNRVDELRDRLLPQIQAIGGAVPVYPILGVHEKWAATPVMLSRQIMLTRELGARGFLLFPDSPLVRAMLPALHLGVTSAAPIFAQSR